MYPILFEFGPFVIYTYGFILFLDVLISLYFIHRYSKIFNLDFDKVFNIYFITLFSLYFGGKIGFVLLNLPIKSLLSNPLELLMVIVLPNEGGLTIIGAIVGALISLFLSSRLYNLDFLKVADLFAVVAPLSIAIGRIGCLMAGCCYGKVCHNCVLTIELAGAPRYPTQLMESSLSLLAFFYLSRESMGGEIKKGTILAKFFIAYGIIRFFVEFFRDSQKITNIFSLDISWAQVFSLFFIILGLIGLKMNSQKREEEEVFYND